MSAHSVCAVRLGPDSVAKGKMDKKQSKHRSVIIWIAFAISVALFIFERENEYGLSPWDNLQDLRHGDDWMGWIHPFGREGRVLPVGPFDSLTHCRNYSFAHLEREYSGWDTAVYFCGYDCEDENHQIRESACKSVTK